MAHFLGGRLVRVVWCEFKSESGHWKKAHLLLSTDAKLTPEQIIEAYYPGHGAFSSSFIRSWK